MMLEITHFPSLMFLSYVGTICFGSHNWLTYLSLRNYICAIFIDDALMDIVFGTMPRRSHPGPIGGLEIQSVTLRLKYALKYQ